MPTTNNIMLISDNIDLAIKIAKDLWKYNTNYCIISTDNGYDYKIKFKEIKGKMLVIV